MHGYPLLSLPDQMLLYMILNKALILCHSPQLQNYHKIILQFIIVVTATIIGILSMDL